MKPLAWTMIATHIPPGGSLGGVVRYTTELTRALSVRDDVVLSALATAPAADTVRGLIGGRGQVWTVPPLPTPALSIVERRLRWPGRDAGADVIQGVKHLVPRTTRAMRVLTIHDMLLLDRSDDFGRAKRALLPASYLGSIADADLLLCVSAATRARLAAYDVAAAQRAAVVGLATSTSLREATPQPLDALQDKQFALVVGDSSPRKNLGTLMAAWTQVATARPDAVLAVAGPPSWGASALGDAFDALVAAGRVVALGHVDDAELRWAYEHAAVVLCPSLAEGFGLPAAEALHFGAPLVISEDAALQEVAAGRARAVVPATDVARWGAAIAEALGDPSRGTGSDNGAGVGRSWDDVAEETVRAVRQALQRRSDHGRP